jgi:hypothetical protein
MAHIRKADGRNNTYITGTDDADRDSTFALPFTVRTALLESLSFLHLSIRSSIGSPETIRSATDHETK